MTRSLLDDAFGHHVWATLRLMDACLELSPEQLETTVPGTYGSIIDTMRHTVGADASYLFVTTGGRTPQIDEDQMVLAELRAEMERHGPAWSELVGGDIDPDERVVAVITGEGLKTLDAVRGTFETHEIDATVDSFETALPTASPV